MEKQPDKEITRSSPEKGRIRGYTMVEIMLAVGLVTILAVMAIPNLQQARRNALETAAIQGLKELSEAEELYYDAFGYFTAGHDQWMDLRRCDAIDAKGYNRLSGRRGVFIRGYSIQLVNLGDYPQNYSIIAWPLERGLNLKTFYIISDSLVRDYQDVDRDPVTIY